ALSTSSLAVAAHQITATYSGDSGFFGSNGSLTQKVSYGTYPLYDQTKAITGGATVPIKLYLLNVSGKDVSSSSVVLHATQLTSVSGFADGMASQGSTNPGDNFRFDVTLGP